MTGCLLDINPAPLVPFQPDWIFWVFLGIFTVIAWIQVFYGPRLRVILSALFSSRHLRQLEREGDLPNERISIALSLVYVFTISMFLYEVMILIFHQTSSSIPPFQLYILLALAVTGFWAFKLFMMNLLSVIFKTENTNKSYLVNIIVAISSLGLLILPFLIFSIYLKSEWLLYIILGLIGIFSVYRIVKGFIIGLSLTRFSYFFLFIYLCTLEILPLLIAAKLILAYH